MYKTKKMPKCHADHMKVGPAQIKIEVVFRDNGMLNSMYVLKYLADQHTDGCIARYIERAVASWIKLHHEKDLLEPNVSKFIDETRASSLSLTEHGT